MTRVTAALAVLGFFISATHGMAELPSSGGGVNIDGEIINVSWQNGNRWTAWGGENGDPQRYVTYRKERAIELKSGCRIDRRISAVTDKVLVAAVKCGAA